MKLTWFGGETFRVHLGGQMIVTGADTAPGGIDAVELLSGADIVVGADWSDQTELLAWRPRKPGRLVDDVPDRTDVGVWKTEGGLLIEAIGEPPLVLSGSNPPVLGRWGATAVVVLWGGVDGVVDAGLALLADGPVRMIAVGLNEADRDVAFEALAGHLDGTGLVALEAALAIEI